MYYLKNVNESDQLSSSFPEGYILKLICTTLAGICRCSPLFSEVIQMVYPASPFGAMMLFQFPGVGLGFSPCLNLPMKQ